MDSSNHKSKKNSKKHLRGDVPEPTVSPSTSQLKDDVPEPTTVPSTSQLKDDVPEPTVVPSTSQLKDDVPEPSPVPSTSQLKDDVPEPSPVPSISTIQFFKDDIPEPPIPPLNNTFIEMKMYEEGVMTTNTYETNNISSYYIFGSIALLGAVMFGYIVKNKKRFLYTPIKDAIPEQSMYEI